MSLSTSVSAEDEEAVLGALEDALRAGDANEVRKLLSSRGSLNLASRVGGGGNTFLHLACDHNALAPIVPYLVRCGAVVNEGNNAGATPLHRA
eukprot:5130546-Prymnesium_polylepis.1